jgi:hypothetical protein
LSWRDWLVIVGIPLSLMASGAAALEAQATADALEDDRRAARFATAEQVLILGPSAPTVRRTTSTSSISWRVDMPELVQNYARLPVSKMTIVVDIKYDDGRSGATYLIRVGSLPPCRQVSITDFRPAGSSVPHQLSTYVLFADPTGRKWKREVGEEPVEVASTEIEGIPEAPKGSLSLRHPSVRIQRIEPCG